MLEKIGDCGCLYKEQKSNLLAALDIAEIRHKGIVEAVRRDESAYKALEVNPENLIVANLELMAKFGDTRNRIEAIPECK